MAAPMTSPRGERPGKSTNIKKKPSKNVLILAQELKLARVLAGNDKVSRDRALRRLKKWFKQRSVTAPFTKDDFMRIWKGLFYSMWMSDKPLIQEECAENISQLVHDLKVDHFFLFFQCGLETLSNEWFGIDQLRLDKFLMFVRRFLRQGFFVLKNNKWSRDVVIRFISTLIETVLNPYAPGPAGLVMHFIEIFLEELAKVSGGKLKSNIVVLMLEPFSLNLAVRNDGRILDHLRKYIFVYLIQQSDLGLEYREKYQVWKQMGFPGSINSLQKIQNNGVEEYSEGEEEEEETGEEQVFDPRAGRVDVVLPQIKFKPLVVKDLLVKYKFAEGSTPKSRKIITQLIDNYKKLSAGVYPYGMKKLNLPKTKDTSVKKAVNRLVKFDKKLLFDSKKKLKNKKKSKQPIKQNSQNTNEVEVEKKSRKRKSTTEFQAKSKRMKVEMEDEGTSNLNIKQGPIESIFRRNSGMWFVTQNLINDNFNKMKTTNEQTANKFELDEALKEGEYEFTVKSPAKNWQIDITTPNLRSRNRFSLDAHLEDKSTPKKVKFNTKLNKSQEIVEHHRQILSSPGLPYDANKKPTKPLLKNTM